MSKKTNTPRTDRKIKSLRQPFAPDVSSAEAQASFDALAEFARKMEKQLRKLSGDDKQKEELKPLIGRDGSVFL